MGGDTAVGKLAKHANPITHAIAVKEFVAPKSTGDIPIVPDAPPPEITPEEAPATNTKPAIEEAKKKQRSYANKGRAATLLTGGDGVTGEAPTSKKTLMGA